MKVLFLKIVYYWIDSFSFYYWNKSFFYIVFDYENVFGVNVVWNFFELGYGKGLCDGIGGIFKWIVDFVIK